MVANQAILLGGSVSTRLSIVTGPSVHPEYRSEALVVVVAGYSHVGVNRVTRW